MEGYTTQERGQALYIELQTLYDEEGGDCNVIDLLTDVRHLCDKHGYDFAALDRTAYQHYLEEKADGSVSLHFEK
jgi:hypothetical protein